MLPAGIVLILTMIYPLITVLFYSTQNVGLAGSTQSGFAGLSNFARVLASDSFPGELLHSIVVAVGSVILSVLLGLGLALLLNGNFPGRTIARSLMILPWAIPAFVAAYAWRWIFDYQYGPLNIVWLSAFPQSAGIAPLSQANLALPTAILIYTWKSIPWTTLVLLAGMQVVRDDLRDAARIDGANRRQEFRHVTLPSIAFAMEITITLLFIWNFNWFDLMWLLTKGGPGEATSILPIELYERAFQVFDTGYASALGVIILCVVIVGTAIAFRSISGRSESNL